MIHWSPLMLVTACLFWAVALVFLGNSLGKAHSRLIAVKVLPPMQHPPLAAHRSPRTAYRSPLPPHHTSQVLFSVCLVVVFAMWTAASLAGAGMRMTNSVYALCGAGIASIFAVLGATVGWGSLKGEISSHPMVKMMGEIGTSMIDLIHAMMIFCGGRDWVSHRSPPLTAHHPPPTTHQAGRSSSASCCCPSSTSS